MKRYFSLLLCLALLTGCSASDQQDLPATEFSAEVFAEQDGVMLYTGEGYEVRQGIDISAHQGEVDWVAVAEDGIEFAILRVGRRGYTEGGILLDDRFEANLQGALDAGLDVGVYFFSQAVSEAEAREEARFVLDAIAGQTITMPVVFDWEHIAEADARTDDVDAQTVTDCAIAFCTEIQAAGYPAMIYFSAYQGYERYEIDRLADWPFWYAGYREWPDFAYQVEMWQYTCTGTVAGVDGDVDRDLYFIKK